MLERFEKIFGPAGKPLSMLIRPAILAPEGRTLVWGDWSNIEARLAPWIADSASAKEQLDVIRRSDEDPDAPDVYEVEAGKILGKDPHDITSEERQGYGKVTVLSLGFGGGVGALQAMAASYGVSFTEDEAQRIVRQWRDGNPWARRIWDELWAAFQEAMNTPHAVIPAGKVAFRYVPEDGRTVYMFLPDGRPISYRNVRWRDREFENEFGEIETRHSLTYWRGDEIKSLWYGEIMNNAVQGTAACRLREAISVLSPAPQLGPLGAEIPDKTPGDIVGHTHDELIAETADDDASIEATADWVYDEMMRVPEWLKGCPIAAEVETNTYYTKAKGVARTLRG